MRHSRKLAAGAFAASALAFATPANATAYNLGTIPLVGNVVSDLVTVGKGSFTDTFTFTIKKSGAGGLQYDNIKIASKNITGAKLALAGPVGFAKTAATSGLTVAVSFLKGVYTATVTGVGAASGGTFVFSVAGPTPEPEAWASMLMGLTLVGFMTWRRKKQTTDSVVSSKPALLLA